MNVSKPTFNPWGNAFSAVVGVIVVVLFLIASVKVLSYLVNAEGAVERYMSKNCSSVTLASVIDHIVGVIGNALPEQSYA
jgi:hypothetical protein